MKIGVYGGAFDPVHFGHVKVGAAAAQYVDFLYVMPCYKSKYGKNLTDGNHRVRMLDLAFKDYSNIIVSDFEIKYQLSGSTYEFMTRFQPLYAGHEFYFVIGEDNALDLKNWDNAEKLLELTNLIVLPRHDKTDIMWYKSKPHMYLDDFESLEVSSTEIRKSKQKVFGKVPDLVDLYMRLHGLYV